MKNNRSLRLFKLIALSLTTVLLLSACNFPALNLGSTTTPEAATPETSSADLPASPTEAAATESSSTGGGGSCLVGKWQIADFSAYFNSISNMIPTGSDVSVTDGSITGTATYEFRADGSGNFVADQFKQAYTMNITANGSNMTIPISVLINGTTETKYSVEGDEITFHDQTSSDTVITIELMGITSEIDSDLLGTPDSIKMYKYQCVDADTLLLKIVETDGVLAPLTLNRVR